MLNNNEEYIGLSISASALVKSGEGQLGGVFCSTSSGGSLIIYDSTTASGTVLVSSFILSAGTSYPFPCRVNNGIYAFISGTASVTFFFN